MKVIFLDIDGVLNSKIWNENNKEEIKRRQHLKDLESRVEEIEGQIRQLEIEITLPDIYENYVLMGEKCKELDEMKRVLALVMEEWVQLSE